MDLKGIMNLSTTSTDNVTELLVHIVEFTERRRQLLMENLIEHDHEDFIPKDLDVNGFADLMTVAVAEHVQNNRILFRDTETISFGSDGLFNSIPLVDHNAKELLKEDKRKYIELQIARFAENSLNNKIAQQLLERVF